MSDYESYRQGREDGLKSGKDIYDRILSDKSYNFEERIFDLMNIIKNQKQEIFKLRIENATITRSLPKNIK